MVRVRALHDGHYGNWVPNPAVMAAELIAQMRDSDGRILIPGFADDVRPLTAAEQAAIARLPPVEDDLQQRIRHRPQRRQRRLDRQHHAPGAEYPRAAFRPGRTNLKRWKRAGIAR